MSKTNQKHQKRMEYISSFIRNYRMNAGKTQNDLSQCTSSVHRNTIIRAEAAKNISLIKLFEILDALELEPHELFFELE